MKEINMKFFNWTIGRKLFAIGFISVGTISCLILVSLFFFGKIGEVSKITGMAFTYEITVKNAAINFDDYILTKDETKYDALIKNLNTIRKLDSTLARLYEFYKAGDTREQALGKLIKNSADVVGLKKAVILIHSLMGTKVGEKLYRCVIDAGDIVTDWLALVDQYHQSQNEINKEQLVSRVTETENMLLNQLKTTYLIMEEIAGHFASKITRIFLIIGFVSVLIIVFSTFFVVRAITSNLKKAVYFAQRMSQNDLTITTDHTTRDETGQLLDSMEKMARSLSETISANIEASISLSDGASGQAASIEQTASSLEEISSMTKLNAKNANQANQVMSEANITIDEANNSMQKLTVSMTEITKASDETSKIIKTIDEIAFQTNLLALNAAVEAARAGESGAGFAVVADEVRNLAMRAAEAAKNTATLIDQTVKKVTDGATLVEKTNIAFTGVAAGVQKGGGLVSEIAEASSEQATGIDQITNAMAEIDKITQQTAAGAEEIAAAMADFKVRDDSISKLVRR
jgi:methyl-accepting chemotaxis protein